MILLLAVAATALMATGLSACSDNDEASRLVQEADSLRVSAVDKFRRSTASVDGLVNGAAAGQALPVNQTKITAEAAVEDLNRALAELTLRDRKLSEAEGLKVSDTYREYLALLKQSNDGLTETINVAQQVPRLLAEEQYSLAGWDEIKTEIIVNQVRGINQQIEQMYSESEMLRNQAEQLRKDNPGDFG